MTDPHMLPPSEDEKETETELKTSLDGTPPKRMVDADEICLSPEQADEVYKDIDEGTRLTIDKAEEIFKLETIEQEGDNNEEPQDSGNAGSVGAHTLNVRPEFQILEQLPQTHPQDAEEEFEALQKSPVNWSLLSEKPMYLTMSDTYYTMNTTTSTSKRSEKLTTHQKRLNLSKKPKMSPKEYLDRYDKVEPVVQKGNQPQGFTEDSCVSMTYLGTNGKSWQDHFELEPRFKINRKCVTIGTLDSGTAMKVFCDSGATRSYMSMDFYKETPELHKLPKYKSRSKGIRQGGKGAPEIEAAFLIPVVFTVQNHRFEVHTLVCDISPEHDIVIGIQNMFELEGELSARECVFRWMNRSMPLMVNNSFTVKPTQRKTIQAYIPFPQKLHGKAVVKMFAGPGVVQTVKVNVVNNHVTLHLHNTGKKTVVVTKKRHMGVLDLRSMGYYKITQDQLMNELKEEFQFIEAREYCESYNKMVDQWNERKKKQQRAKREGPDPFPWLEADDPRRYMTDEQILRQLVNLDNSKLNSTEKEELRKMMIKYKEAFSLRDEIGECPNMKIDVELTDDTPFFVRPFPIATRDKPFMDRQMARLVHLGILTKNASTSHTSPVMLISRKLTNDKRPVVDFRQLNTRVLRRNVATPIMRDILHILGASNCDILSCVDLKDAYHSIPLTEKSKEYCGIIPYYGSPPYRYNVLPMGLSISPAKWMEYVNLLFDKIDKKDKFLAIMDDVLIHSSMKDHWVCLENLFKALIKHGLKLSPKKCQLFREVLVYMGHNFKVTKKGIQVTPLRTRVEAMEKTPIPQNAKEVKSFCGVANYLAMFLPQLQKHLRPLYDLTKKGAPFHWTKYHTIAFNLIKEKLCQEPVLYCPTPEGRYTLYSDTSRKYAGSSLWQNQRGIPRLIGYASKTLPQAAENYSVTELEMFGLLQNMKSWQWFLGHNEFDCAVDHRAIVYIMTAKTQNATPRIGVLLHKLMEFSFKLSYVKGKDMILADWLSRTGTNTRNPHELVPVSFEPRQIITQIQRTKLDEFSVTVCRSSEKPKKRQKPEFQALTRGQAKAENVQMPEVHGAQKGLDPAKKPEWDKVASKAQAENRIPIDVATGRPCNTLRPHQLQQNARVVIPTSQSQLMGRKLIRRSISTLNKKPRVTFGEDTKVTKSSLDRLMKKPLKTNIQPSHSILPKPVNYQKNSPNSSPIQSTRVLRSTKNKAESKIATKAQTKTFSPMGTKTNKTVTEQRSKHDNSLLNRVQRDNTTHMLPKANEEVCSEAHLNPEQNLNQDFEQDRTDLVDLIKRWKNPVRPDNQNREQSFFPETQRKTPGRDLNSNFDTDPGLDLQNPESNIDSDIEYERPNLKDFETHPSWAEKLKQEEILKDNLPTQADIADLMKHLEQKVLRHTHLPLSYRDMQAAYLDSPHFKDIYLFLTKGTLPKKKNAAHKVLTNADKYMLWGPVLHLIYQDKFGKWNGKPCIPTSKVDQLLQEYHSTMKGGHQGITKVYQTLSDRYHIPNLAQHVQAYIIGCNHCELFRDREKQRPFQKRVNLNVPALSKISMDVKFMPPGKNGYKFILVMVCEVSNFMVAVPLKDRNAEEITTAFLEKFVIPYGIPTHVICDQDRAFLSKTFQELMRQIGTRLMVVSVTNHKSLKAEHGIKSLSGIITKYLTDNGREWPEMVGISTLNYNTFASPNLDGFSPYELVFGHKARIMPELEIEPQLPVGGTLKKFHQNLNYKLDQIRRHMQKYRDKKVDMQNRDREPSAFQVGQLVHMFQPRGSFLNTRSRKIRCKYVGPLVIYKAISDTQFLLMTIDGMVYPHLVEETRLKAVTLHSSQGPIRTLAQLRKLYNRKMFLDE